MHELTQILVVLVAVLIEGHDILEVNAGPFCINPLSLRIPLC